MILAIVFIFILKTPFHFFFTFSDKWRLLVYIILNGLFCDFT